MVYIWSLDGLPDVEGVLEKDEVGAAEEVMDCSAEGETPGK